ncbi:MAG: PEP-CTERM sorting domain-containing protein [Planctomycetaceae bacterium]|nr:PEP-CTERM sorting domain-containing protein [Planctomycetaceae bacterium]
MKRVIFVCLVVVLLGFFANSVQAVAAAGPTWNSLNSSYENTVRYTKALRSYGWKEETFTYWGNINWGMHNALSTFYSGLRVMTSTAVVWQEYPYYSSWGRFTAGLSGTGVAGQTVPVRVVIDRFDQYDSGNYKQQYGLTGAFGEGTLVVRDMTTGQILQQCGISGTGVVGGILEIPKTSTVGLELKSVSDLSSNQSGILLSLDLIGHLEYSPDLYRGMIQEYAILPDDEIQGGGFSFANAQSGYWFDPPFVSEFEYQMTSGSLFTKIGAFPTGFDAAMQVLVNGVSLGTFGAGDSVDFVSLLGAGVSEFTVRGINPLVDAEDELGFPLQLEFDTTTASFDMIPVPEPATICLLGLGVLGFVRRKKINKNN